MEKRIKIIVPILMVVSIILVIVKVNLTPKEISLKMNCNGRKTNVNISNGSSIKCKLMGDDWEFNVKNINKDSVTIKTKEYGLIDVNKDGEINLLEKKNEFVIKKDKELVLETQTMDYSETLILEYK